MRQSSTNMIRRLSRVKMKNSRSSIDTNLNTGSVSRRELFSSIAGGLGSIALACLLGEDAAAQPPNAERRTPNALHYPPKAKRVIQIFCTGGVSHIDTFDYKSELEKNDGKEMKGKGKVDTFFGQPGNLMKSPFKFARHGQSGHWASDLLPNLAECVDDLTFIPSMTAKSSNHTPATFQMNSGFTLNGFPCLGAWLSYGLGTENQDLPAFVVLPDSRGIPAGGSINWTNGFLPATHQGTALRTAGEPIVDLFPPPDVSAVQRNSEMGLLAAMNRDYSHNSPEDSTLAPRIPS